MNDSDKVYTHEELEHRVAHEVAKQRVIDVESNLERLRGEYSSLVTSVTRSIDDLSNKVEGVHRHIDSKKIDLRDEFSREFATKLEMKSLESKIDKMWIKISAPIAAILIIMQLALPYVGKLVGG